MENITVDQITSYVGLVVTIASVITALTPTPKEGTTLAKFYRLIDVLAINVHKAKDK